VSQHFFAWGLCQRHSINNVKKCARPLLFFPQK
jgi:hypothetical protein